jgi:molecular chaperone HscB
MTTDYFSVFDLPRRLTLDTSDLQKRFYDRSRESHPDRFATKSAFEQQRALDVTSSLNDGYRVLRDPVQRAEYLLKLEGFDVSQQRGKDVPPELLDEVFELNMMLEDAASNKSELQDAKARFEGMLHRADCELEHEFGHYDSSPDASVLSVIRTILNRRRYIRNLLRDVDKALASS